MAGRLDAKLPVKAGLVLITLVATAAVCLGSFPMVRDLHEHYVLGLENDNAGLAIREAVKWMKDNVPEDAVVVSNAGPMTSFYLGRDALFLGVWQNFDPSDIDPEYAVGQMRAKGVEYLVVFAYTASVEDAFKLAGIPLRDG